MINDQRLLVIVSNDLSLIVSLVTWFSIMVWLRRSGWRMQRRYFVDATLTPLRRTPIVWAAGLIGLLTLVVSIQRPASPAIVAVAMIGCISAYIDARTHRLPNAYTAAMDVGVGVGVATAALTAESLIDLGASVLAGIAVWFIPMWLLSRVPGGVGYGDVKISPVLGAMLGCVSIEAAVFGFIVSFIAAGLGALAQVVVGSAGTRTRMPMGPWLISGALAAHILWGIIPDWTGAPAV